MAQAEKTHDLPPKVLRYFPQRKSVADANSECPPRLSKDVLAGVLLKLNFIIQGFLITVGFANKCFLDHARHKIYLFCAGIWTFIIIIKILFCSNHGGSGIGLVFMDNYWW